MRGKRILYIDKKTYKVNVFEMENEEETAKSLKRTGKLAAKYLLQGIEKDRYLVLYSLKKETIIKIDTENMKELRPKYSLDTETLQKMGKVKNKIFDEGKEIDRAVFIKALYS